MSLLICLKKIVSSAITKESQLFSLELSLILILVLVFKLQSKLVLNILYVKFKTFGLVSCDTYDYFIPALPHQISIRLIVSGT